RADDYEDNQHYFLSQYFRDNFNRALALAPIISTDINITQIEVWVSNRNNSYEDARDVLALMDLGEQNPYNPIITRGASALPSTRSEERRVGKDWRRGSSAAAAAQTHG